MGSYRSNLLVDSPDLTCQVRYIVVPNEPVEKVTFFKIASSAGSQIENCFLSLKALGSGIGLGLDFEKASVIIAT
jgi:hypothetical protein